MSLGAKKREALVDAACAAMWPRWSGLAGDLAAVVDMMLAREEARVRPLVRCLRDAEHRMRDDGLTAQADYAASTLAADAAAQADESEPLPTLAEAMDEFRAEVGREPCDQGRANVLLAKGIDAYARERGAS